MIENTWEASLRALDAEVDRHLLRTYPLLLSGLIRALTACSVRVLEFWASAEPERAMKLITLASDRLAFDPASFELLQLTTSSKSLTRLLVRHDTSILERLCASLPLAKASNDKIFSICTNLLSHADLHVIGVPVSISKYIDRLCVGLRDDFISSIYILEAVMRHNHRAFVDALGLKATASMNALLASELQNIDPKIVVLVVSCLAGFSRSGPNRKSLFQGTKAEKVLQLMMGSMSSVLSSYEGDEGFNMTILHGIHNVVLYLEPSVSQDWLTRAGSEALLRRIYEKLGSCTELDLVAMSAKILKSCQWSIENIDVIKATAKQIWERASKHLQHCNPSLELCSASRDLRAPGQQGEVLQFVLRACLQQTWSDQPQQWSVISTMVSLRLLIENMHESVPTASVELDCLWSSFCDRIILLKSLQACGQTMRLLLSELYIVMVEYCMQYPPDSGGLSKLQIRDATRIMSCPDAPAYPCNAWRYESVLKASLCSADGPATSDWRTSLSERLDRDAKAQCQEIIATFSKVCLDLEQRVETHEQPSRQLMADVQAATDINIGLKQEKEGLLLELETMRIKHQATQAVAQRTEESLASLLSDLEETSSNLQSEQRLTAELRQELALSSESIADIRSQLESNKRAYTTRLAALEDDFTAHKESLQVEELENDRLSSDLRETSSALMRVQARMHQSELQLDEATTARTTERKQFEQQLQIKSDQISSLIVESKQAQDAMMVLAKDNQALKDSTADMTNILHGRSAEIQSLQEQNRISAQQAEIHMTDVAVQHNKQLSAIELDLATARSAWEIERSVLKEKEISLQSMLKKVTAQNERRTKEIKEAKALSKRLNLVIGGGLLIQDSPGSTRDSSLRIDSRNSQIPLQTIKVPNLISSSLSSDRSSGKENAYNK